MIGLRSAPELETLTTAQTLDYSESFGKGTLKYTPPDTYNTRSPAAVGGKRPGGQEFLKPYRPSDLKPLNPLLQTLVPTPP